jgi:hypothetical protein
MTNNIAKEINGVFLAFFFHFGPCILIRWTKQPRNALIIQCIDTLHSPTCFGTLKCRNQEINHDPAEIGTQCCRNRRRMEASYCSRWRDGQNITEY